MRKILSVFTLVMLAGLASAQATESRDSRSEQRRALPPDKTVLNILPMETSKSERIINNSSGGFSGVMFPGFPLAKVPTPAQVNSKKNPVDPFQ